jgi:hypothetical protein
MSASIPTIFACSHIVACAVGITSQYASYMDGIEWVRRWNLLCIYCLFVGLATLNVSSLSLYRIGVRTPRRLVYR